MPEVNLGLISAETAAHIASEWHGGQWSGLYAVSCSATKDPSPLRIQDYIRALAEVGSEYEALREAKANDALLIYDPDTAQAMQDFTQLGDWLRYRLGQLARRAGGLNGNY
jgi:hypothetical protein